MSEIQQRNLEVLADIRTGRDALYDGILRLERALSTPARGRVDEWCRTVAARVEALQTTFARHIALTEGDAGLFEAVMDQAPRLAHAIDRLRVEHAALGSSLDDERHRLDAVHDLDDVEARRGALLDLIRELFGHRHRGAELVYEAYDVDLAAAD